jgi:hypothetical protein
VAGLRTLDAKGEERLVYDADDFERIAGLVLPEKRRFVVAASNDDFSLTGLEVELNPDLPDGLFGLEPPSGTQIHFVGTGRETPPMGDLCGE